jgi:hypothetical protein
MRRAPIFAALGLLGACAAPQPRPKAAPAASSAAPAAMAVPAPAPQEPPEVRDPNFVLVVSESVPDPNDDGIAFTKVFVDGQEKGKTSVGRKSEPRTLKLKLAPGNVLVRLEQWVLPGIGEMIRLDDTRQPRERFVRIEDGSIARLELRFTDGEASNTLVLSRESAAR